MKDHEFISPGRRAAALAATIVGLAGLATTTEVGAGMPLDLGKVGIWSRELRYHPDRGARAAAAAEVEDLGYTAIFIPDVGGNVLDEVAHLLAATRRIPLATGVLNIWMHDPADVSRQGADLASRFGPRFLLGLGSSHQPLVEPAGYGPYLRPYSRMVGYLDALDAVTAIVPTADRMLAALGPRMLSLARDRAGAAHPYLVPPEHTAFARQILGEGPVLAPEQAVILEPDRQRGHELARAFVRDYLALPNYVRNLRRLGFGDDDFAGHGSDRLVDALVVHGDEEVIAARIRAHHEAGADHVCIYVVGGSDETLPLGAWQRLAPALTSGRGHGVGLGI